MRAFSELDLVLVGDEERIKNGFGRHRKLLRRVTILHTQDVIGMGEDPASSVRARQESSVVLAARAVARGEAFGFFSPGNTGATIAAATLHTGLLPGVLRAALATLLPTGSGHMLLLDSGAGVDLTPDRFLCFGRLGEAFMKSLFGLDQCRICLLNIGEEPNKGTRVLRRTHALLSRRLPSFTGNIEPSDIFSGSADVVLCDGFVGNIFIKLCEGIGRQMQRLIRQPVHKRLLPSQKERASVLEKTERATRQSILRHLKKFTDPEVYGGAPLLGLKGIVLAGHGKSGPSAVYNAIAAAIALNRSQMVEKMRAAFAQGGQDQHSQP